MSKGLLVRFGLALAGFAIVVVVWQLAVWLFKMHPITLPPPLTVMKTGWEERDILLKGFFATGAAALLGLAASLVVGLVIAVLFSQSKLLRSAFYPYVIFLQTVPIVAIAPLLITWFGYGFQTVVLVSMVISLFPIISNVTAGLISVDENLRDLFQLSRATRLQILLKLRIPNALGHLVLGMRISAGLAVIGAIVGEFFVGNGSGGYAGLGTVMTGWQNLARTDGIIAAIFVSTLLGLAILGIVNGVAALTLRRWTSGASFENE